MRLGKYMMIVAASLAVVACGPTAEQRCAGAKDPATCAAVASSGGDVQGYLLGGLAGAAIASAATGSSRQPVYVESHARPTRTSWGHTKTITTTTKRGLFGRSVSRTTTSLRPSFRSRR